MDEDELTIKVDAGVIAKELDPDVPADVQAQLEEAHKIFRFRFVQVSGSTETRTTRKKQKEEEVQGGDVDGVNILVTERICFVSFANKRTRGGQPSV